MYIEIGSNQTEVKLGRSAPDSPGDFLERLIIIVSNAGDCEVSLIDGDPGTVGASYVILPDNPGSGVGVYPVVLNMQSKMGQWRITTAAGANAIAVGTFL